MGRTSTTSLPIIGSALSLLFSLISSIPGNSQALGLEPPSTKWKIIESPYAEIIFEPQNETKAQRVANLVTYLAERDSSFIGGPAQPVPIILHSQSTLPAGVPNLAPWRSDWSLAAPQDPFMGALVWVDGLTIHEYRHHQQMTRGKHGIFSDFLRVLLGQTGWYVGVLTIQPNWFFEGDATYAETVLTDGGRGRMPKFDREYRTLRLSGLNYNYEKSSRFSRKDFVPNIYREGYYLTAFARRHLGADIWTRVLDDTYRRKIFFYPFSRSLKSITGYRTKDLFDAAMKELDSIWIDQDKKINPNKTHLISTTPKKVYTDYKFPHYVSDNEILVEKSSFQQIRTFYIIGSDGIEERLFQPGNVTSDHLNLTSSGNIITWAENRFHPRWDLKDYGVIFKYDLTTGKKTQLTRKTRFFSPAPASDGSRIIALELKTDGNQQLVLIDGNSGDRIKEFENPDMGQYAYPRITENDQYLITGYTDSRGNTLQRIHLETGDTKNLLPFSNKVATRPYDKGDYIYFSGTHTGINNIYALKKANGEVYKITSSRFGAYMPTVSMDGQKLVFSEYTAMGFEIREMNLDPDQYVSFDLNIPSMLNYYQPLSELEGGSILKKVPNKVYTSQPFRSYTKGLIKIHSWTPSLDENEYGLELLSNNIMSNTAAKMGYRYNFKENTSVAYGNLSYGALFPVVDLGYSFNLRNSKTLFNDQYQPSEYDWQESVVSGGFTVPFKLSTGTNSSNLQFSGQYKITSLSNSLVTESISQSKSFGSINGGIEFYRIKNRGRQQIRPVWGQAFSMNYQTSLEGQNQAKLLYVNGTLYFPGLDRKHSFFLTGSYQQENLTNSYRFENVFQNARGYHERYFPDSVNTDFESIRFASVNYFFPIAFPDFDLGSIAYLQSITANLYYDYSIMDLNGTNSFMRSAGIDIGFEFTSLRLLRTSLILRGLHRLDKPYPEMKPFLFDIVFEITDLAF